MICNAELPWHRAQEDVEVVRRNLVSEAAAAAVEHHDHLLRHVETEAARERRVDDALRPQHLDLQVVVAGAERADLPAARARAPSR